ncbi:GDP-L-fucose synthase [Bdellovibrionota bacterium FG-2]
MAISPSDSIYIAGHQGLVGSALVRKLQSLGYANLITRSQQELNLLDQRATHAFFETQRIDHVFLAAARVGGIHANSTYPADFLYENLVIATNVIHAAATNNTKKLLFLGSSCIYPRLAPQPIKEESLLTLPLEKTNEAYAIAKIAGLKLCEYYFRQYGKAFVSAMPTNLYGPGDNFHPENSHVIPGMMRRVHEAKLAGARHVTIWGTGTPLREFLHVDDLAEALVFLMNNYSAPETINAGSGQELTIGELAQLMKKVVGFKGDIIFDLSRPDGTPRKCMDNSRLQALGWKPKISFEEGLARTYEWAVANGKLG